MIAVDDDIREYETLNTQEYSNINELITHIDATQTGIIYSSHIRQMVELQLKLTELKIPSIAIWSIRNKDRPMSDEQLTARQYILNNEKLPPQYRVVIINASCETSINIKSHVDYMIIHTTEQEVQTQVRGRYRGDLQQLYLFNSEALHVPDNFLNRKLFKDDKDELCSILKCKNKSGNICGWTTVKKKLSELGYTIEESREHNLRYSIISI